MKRAVLIGGAIAAVLAAIVAAALAFSGPSGCHLVGCRDGVDVLVEPLDDKSSPVYLRACVLRKCRRVRIGGAGAQGGSLVHFPCPGVDSETRVRITGVLMDRSGKVLSYDDALVAIRRNEPNGPECSPTCWGGLVGYLPEQGRFITGERLREIEGAPTG